MVRMNDKVKCSQKENMPLISLAYIVNNVYSLCAEHSSKSNSSLERFKKFWNAVHHTAQDLCQLPDRPPLHLDIQLLCLFWSSHPPYRCSSGLDKYMECQSPNTGASYESGQYCFTLLLHLWSRGYENTEWQKCNRAFLQHKCPLDIRQDAGIWSLIFPDIFLFL